MAPGSAFPGAWRGLWEEKNALGGHMAMFFPAFIAAFEPARDVPYLADVARLEDTRTRAYHAAVAARQLLHRAEGHRDAMLSRFARDSRGKLKIARSHRFRADAFVVDTQLNRGLETRVAQVRHHSANGERLVPGGLLQGCGAGLFHPRVRIDTRNLPLRVCEVGRKPAQPGAVTRSAAGSQQQEKGTEKNSENIGLGFHTGRSWILARCATKYKDNRQRLYVLLLLDTHEPPRT